MLEQQRIDIGLVVKQKSAKNMDFIPVMDIEDIFVATPSYLENLRLREGADTDVFQSGNLMLLDKNNITRHYIDDYMTVNDIVANNLLEVTTMDLLIEFARIGLGIRLCHQRICQRRPDSGRLVQLKLDTPIHKRTVGIFMAEQPHLQGAGYVHPVLLGARTAESVIWLRQPIHLQLTSISERVSARMYGNPFIRPRKIRISC